MLVSMLSIVHFSCSKEPHYESLLEDADSKIAQLERENEDLHEELDRLRSAERRDAHTRIMGLRNSIRFLHARIDECMLSYKTARLAVTPFSEHNARAALEESHTLERQADREASELSALIAKYGEP